ncbi:MAG: amino acid adenylation domain-containing protein, partial [Akkermansiaceae bacterium]|nr:amino acid adenylation domain-containing protein [Akkermansiaceae bacterium]
DVVEAAAYVVGGDHQSRIEAAATVKGNTNTDPAAIMDHVKTRLPWYALPSTIAVVSDFPRTTTGKIDRRALQT